MYCPNCGTASSEGDIYCRTCGSRLNNEQTEATAKPPHSPTPMSSPPVSVYIQGTPSARPQRTSGLSVASFVLSLVGLSLLAIIFGLVVMGQTQKDPNLSGRGLAVAGFVIGLIEFLIEVFIFIFILGVAHSI